MPTKLKDATPPRGIMRLLLRLPIWLFHWHLGWIAGQRFLLLNHIGRKSGQKRQSVLEVLGYEQHNRTYYVFSGFGQRSDWVRNIEQTPQVTLQVGGGVAYLL
jgi:deazaflavin-dependent oxidoreductase (nitroreductase family)